MEAQPTPFQTIGPFYGEALPFEGGAAMAPPDHPDAITLHGHVYDGAGDPVPDALLEFWQPAPDGMGRPGSLARNGVDFTGFGRVPTDAAGHWVVRTLAPGPVPYLAVAVFARGLPHHLFTRVYLRDVSDPLLDALEPERRRTLMAEADPDARGHRFDVRLQGERETVFLTFP
ncbi:protocatechuate 3,4-dioxygenase subunit alpha [Streptomyces sp. CBMA152]|uniref:protocatechuate 3,4-dioxygenase subunit alpha n=1 Tax=Streptomyces sp. CBMA152 TaxID=1896312 RepID=UPI0016610783|nr:protocatechuate 3,4-dioxygenase subunit alpha [Streptomyces sp. CBMA152]MBD0747767.1 protocatechuate 3,4-dioxygenase subunit alpha [Streptomyces sp. CBMA152]